MRFPWKHHWGSNAGLPLGPNNNLIFVSALGFCHFLHKSWNLFFISDLFLSAIVHKEEKLSSLLPQKKKTHLSVSLEFLIFSVLQTQTKNKKAFSIA